MVEKDSEMIRVTEQLIRLDSATNLSVLLPDQRLVIAMEAEREGVRPVARKYDLQQHVVTRAKRDVAAALIFLSENPEMAGEEEVLKQVGKLQMINKELGELAFQLSRYSIKHILRKVPHVDELLAGYIRYRTVKPMLDSVGMICSPSQLKGVRTFLMSDSVEDSQNGLEPLARRYLFAKWLRGYIPNADSRISKAAEFALTTGSTGQPKRVTDAIGTVRTFLGEVIEAEFASTGRGAYSSPEDMEMFPKSYSGTEKEVIEVYRNFGVAGYCPEVLKRLARMVVEEVPWPERMKSLGFEYYSHSWLNGLNRAGVKFLENVLACSRQQRVCWPVLLADTGETLKTIKRKLLGG